MQGLTEEQRVIVTQKIMAAVDDWGLSGEQIMAVLDMPQGERTAAICRDIAKTLRFRMMIRSIVASFV